METEYHKPGTKRFVDFWQGKVDRVRIYIEHSTGMSPGNITQELPVLKNRHACHKLFTDLVIYWNGEVGLCNHDWTRLNGGQPIANVQHSSIAEIWRSDEYTEFRNRHIAGDVTDMVPCNGCDHWKMYYLDTGFMGRVYPKQGDE